MFLIHLNHTAGHLAASIDRARLTCFGQKMNEISYIDRDDIEYAKAIVDPELEECVYIEIIVPGYAQAFQWIHPEHQHRFYDYLASRNQKNIAFGNVEFQNVVSEETILTYLRDVGEGYYDNLPIPS